MSIRFYIQNAGWSVLNPSQAYQAKKAMDKYRKLHPLCEITGSNKSVQVHHIIPVFADSTLAADMDNMISLSTSANIHLIFGHNGNFGARYVKNIKTIAEEIRNTTSTAEVAFKQDISALNTKHCIICTYVRLWIATFLTRFKKADNKQ